MRSSPSQLRSIVPMMLGIGIAALCAAAICLHEAGPISAAQTTPEVIPAPPATIQDAAASPHYIGSSSCAARACHGNPSLSPGREWNSSYGVWAAKDPHAQAFSVLFTPESKRMATALGLADASKVERCLACHSLPVAGTRAGAALNGADSLLADGVGCEACHGPAENYLAAHTMRGWQQLGAARFEPKFGMQNTADIAARAQMCAGCHVGQPDAKGGPWRDVNHDLIAAGHPRLNFEFSAYMAALPPHWNVQKDKSRFEELHSWIAGQIATSSAAVRLLESRAVAAKSDATGAVNRDSLIASSWPELSEYDCYACHHGLGGKSWRQDINALDLAKPPRGQAMNAANEGGDRPPRKPGAPAWGTWYFETPRLLANTEAVVPKANGHAFIDALNSLTQRMQTPLPDASRVAIDAAACGTELANLGKSAIDHLPANANSGDATNFRREIVNSLAKQFQNHKPESWDAFVQYYLALVAVHRSEVDAAKPRADRVSGRKELATGVLEEIRNRLSFPTDSATSASQMPSPNLRVLRSGINSPEQFDPYAKPMGTSPGDFGGKNLFELFDRAFGLLTAPGSTL